MLFLIDFNSEEALYIQLRNQIIMAIATETMRKGDALPSVRQLAESIGINMHTVNKAYTVLKQEGFIKLDRRKGAVIAPDINKMRALEEMQNEMEVLIAKGICKSIGRKEVHELVDKIYNKYLGDI